MSECLMSLIISNNRSKIACLSSLRSADVGSNRLDYHVDGKPTSCCCWCPFVATCPYWIAGRARCGTRHGFRLAMMKDARTAETSSCSMTRAERRRGRKRDRGVG